MALKPDYGHCLIGLMPLLALMLASLGMTMTEICHQSDNDESIALLQPQIYQPLGADVDFPKKTKNKKFFRSSFFGKLLLLAFLQLRSAAIRGLRAVCS